MLFNYQIQALERNPGQEESIFYDLVQFASHQGILMPFGHPERTDSDQEGQSLNTIVIESRHATDVLWEAIRKKLRKGMWTLFSNLPLPVSGTLCDERKFSLLHNLCFLYPAEEIWKGYKTNRQKLMDQYVRDKSLLQNLKGGFLICSENELTDDVLSFVKICKAAEIMILEDATILQEGLFPEMVSNFEFIRDLYLAKITEELRSVCESFGTNTDKKCQDERLPSTRRGSLVSLGRQSGEERQAGNRRGSYPSNVNHIDPKQILLTLSQCFSSVVGLEILVNGVINQRSNADGTGEYNPRQK